MYIFGYISVKQRQLPDPQVDSGPCVVQLCENKSGLNTSEVAKLAINITHSDISRGHSPLSILSKVYLKSEWRSSWILLIHWP